MARPSLDEIFQAQAPAAPAQPQATPQRPSLDAIFKPAPSVGDRVAQQQAAEAEYYKAKDAAAHPISTAINKTADESTDIPVDLARLANSRMLGWPGYVAKRMGHPIPEPKTAPGKAMGTTADIVGFATNPIFKAMGLNSLPQNAAAAMKIAAKVPVAGAAAGALSSPDQSSITKTVMGGDTNAPQSLTDLALNQGAKAAEGYAVPKAVNTVVEGVGNALSKTPELLRGVSGRIHDWIVKLPKGAFNYSKDPLDVLAKEKITANTITDYAAKAADRLKQRSAELEEAVKGSDATVDATRALDTHIQGGKDAIAKSLKDRTGVDDQIAYMVARLNEQYGDLTNLPVSKAIALKRQLADDFPFKNSGVPADDILAKTAHKIYHDLDSLIDKAAPEVAELNHRVSGLIDISKAATNRMGVESRNNPLGLIGSMTGIALATHAGGIEGGAGAALAIKILTSPAAMTRVANSLSSLSEADLGNLFRAAPWFRQVVQKARSMSQDSPDLTAMASKGSTSPVGEGFAPKGLQALAQRPAYNPTFEGTDGVRQSNMAERMLGNQGKVNTGALAATAAAGGLTALATKANASSSKKKINDEDAIKTIIGEAESEGPESMHAIASTIRNRGTLQGAYGLHSPRVVGKKYSQKIYDQAKQAWEASQSKNASGGANHWFSDADLKKANVQKMIKTMKFVKKLKGTSFYREG